MTTVLKKGSDKTTIDSILKKVQKKKSSRGLDATKYAGTVKFKLDGLDLQKQLRDEWE